MGDRSLCRACLGIRIGRPWPQTHRGTVYTGPPSHSGFNMEHFALLYWSASPAIVKAMVVSFKILSDEREHATRKSLGGEGSLGRLAGVR